MAAPFSQRAVTCKNCGYHFSGNYCNACGQSAAVYKITWKEIASHVPHALLHLDDGFFYTLVQLAKRPGYAIREYLEGKRKPHYNPFLLMLIIAGICSWLLVHFKLQTVFASVHMEQLELQKPLIAHKYFASRNIIFCLVCALGDYLIFKERKLTLPEAFVANVFMFSGLSLIHLVFVPVFLLAANADATDIAKALFITAALLYMFVCRYQLYQANKRVGYMLKIALAIGLYLAVFMIVGIKLVKPIIGV